MRRSPRCEPSISIARRQHLTHGTPPGPDSAAAHPGQLKILQEVITLSVFVPFALLYLREPLKLDYLWAALCILGAVFFVFRGKWAGV